MTLMVIYSYLIRKNTYKYQKPSFETLANFQLNQHFVGLKKGSNLNSRLIDKHISAEGWGREGK